MRAFSPVRLAAALTAAFVILACGGGGGGGGSIPSGVVLNVSSASLAFGQNLNLTATVPGVSNQGVTWAATAGTIVRTGLSTATYTAPNVAGTYTITATSEADASKKGTCTVAVSQVGISIDPQSVSLAPGGTTTFTATVIGASNVAATFTATGGTLTPIGNHMASYRAPNVAGTYTVTARAVANTTKTATATVVVGNVGSNSTVAGKVYVDGTTIGVSGIVVQFFNSGGAEVARATTNASGSFSAQVPTSARRFHLLATSFSASYYKAYEYRTIRYTPLVNTCTAPLPSLSAGATANLPGSIFLSPVSGPPPPPPNGCG